MTLGDGAKRLRNGLMSLLLLVEIADEGDSD
jgi:hypothetical protein